MKILESNAAEINGDYILTSVAFENMSMMDTYDNYGQSVSPEDAGAAVILTVEQGDKLINDVNIESIEAHEREEWEETLEDWKNFREHLLGGVTAYDQYRLYRFFSTCEGVEINSYQVKAHNYWDGNNWQTVTIEDECTDPHYKDLAIDDADESRKIIEEWGEKEFIEEKNGWRYYESANYKFSTSAWQGDWFTAIVDCK